MGCSIVSLESDIYERLLDTIGDQKIATAMTVRYNLSKKPNLHEFLRLRYSFVDKMRKQWPVNKAFNNERDAKTWYEEASKVFDFVRKPYLQKDGNWNVYIYSPKVYTDLFNTIDNKVKLDLDQEFRDRMQTGKYVEKDGDILVDYLNEVKTPYVKILSNLDILIKQTDAARSAAIARKDRKNELKLTERLELLSERSKQITEDQKLQDILAIARADLGFIEEMLNSPNIDPVDINFASSILDFWSDNLIVYDFLSDSDKSLEDGKLSTNRAAIDSIILSAQRYAPSIQTLQNTYILDQIKNMTGKDYSESILKQMNDIDWATANFRDASMTNNTLMQFGDQTIKREMYKAEKAANEMFNSIEDLSRKVKNKGGFDQFLQKDKDGNVTGNMVHPYIQEYIEQYNQMKRSARFASKDKDYKPWDEVFKWEKRNTILIDWRKLFQDEYRKLGGVESFTDKDIEDHKEQLKDRLGDRLYNKYIEVVEKNKDDFLEFYNEYSRYVDSLELSDGDKHLRTTYWLTNRSPFAFADSFYSNHKITEVSGKKVYFNRAKFEERFSTIIPGLDEFYDNDFDKVSEDDDLYNFYSYFKDTVSRFRSYFPRYLTSGIYSNHIPYLPKTFLNEISEKGIPQTFSILYERLIKDIREAEEQEISYTERDLSGKEVKKLNISMLEVKLNASEIVNIKSQLRELGLEEGTLGYQNKYKELEEQAKITKKSYDLEKVLKAFAAMSLTYMHKAQVEDKVRMINNIINEAFEKSQTGSGLDKKDRNGNLILQEGSLTNLKSLWDHVQDMFYGSYKDISPSSKKVYTPKEKKQIKEINNELEKLEELYSNKEISDDEFISKTDSLKKDIESLGGNLVYSNIGDRVLQYLHIKSLGWNAFSAINNFSIGIYSNMTHAAGGQDFTFNDLMKSYRLILNSVAKTATLDIIETEIAEKINNLMNVYGVLGTVAEELTESNLYKSRLGSGAKKLMPYEITKRVEYVNQGTTFLAMMFYNTIEDLNGKKRPLWDAYNKDGKWNSKEFGEEDLDKFSAFRAKIDQVKKIIHGNYDALSKPKLKRKFLGRALLMFRSWVAEGFAERMEKEKFDITLDRVRKGRWREYQAKHLMIIPALTDFYTAFKNPEKFDDIKAASMRKNAVEISTWLSMLAIAILIKSSLDDDDDDKFLANYTLNQIYRLNTDLEFYISPMSFEKLQRQSIPAFQLAVDIDKFGKATYKFLIGEDIIPTGEYAGQSGFKRALFRLLPGTSSYLRQKSAGERVDK